MPEPPDDHGRRTGQPLADAEIYQRLADQNFDPHGDDWIAFSGTLIGYGYSVFTGWLIGGDVHHAAASQGPSGVRGLSRIPKDLRLRQDDAHDLTMTLLEAAIERYRQGLRDGLWRPDGGASLCTFFIGRCLMEFPDVYVRWRRQQDRWAREIIDISGVDDGRFSTDPCDQALAAVQLDEILPPKEFEHVRVMLEFTQRGYTVAETAELLTRWGFPYTAAAVRSRINRARSRARAHRDETEREERGDGRD